MRIEKIEDAAPKATEKYFLDSNVWLYLLYPQSSHISQRYIKQYSNFLDQLTSKNCLVLTNLIQVSEMVNVVMQVEYRRFVKSGGTGSFKDFRGSSAGIEAMGEAKTLMTQVMKIATPLTGTFNQDEIKAMVAQCDQADFNDIYFAVFCQKQDAMLVTHDFDFNALNVISIGVLSANEKYF